MWILKLIFYFAALQHFNWTLFVVQPLMTTPKGSRLPQHSFFHTPVPVSPLAAVVTTSGLPATKTVYIPQRKLDVSTEDSWWETPPLGSCINLGVNGWLRVFVCLVFYSIHYLWTFHSFLVASLISSSENSSAADFGSGPADFWKIDRKQVQRRRNTTVMLCVTLRETVYPKSNCLHFTFFLL